MLRSLLPLLACPNCGSALSIAEERDADAETITSGLLMCSDQTCEFEIERGIPRLMPTHLLDAQADEMQARDAQIKQYDANAFLNVFGRFEIPRTVAQLAPELSDRLLEAGCGTGRMTSILSGHVREMIAVDFSFRSLLTNSLKLQAAGITNVHLAQADICNLPLADNVFDRALSCQVLEHVPGDDARRRAVTSIARVVKPGARVVISAYQHSLLMGRKEGRHGGGIPYFRFTADEFKELLSREFEVNEVTGSLVYLHMATCTRSPEPADT